MPRPSRWWSIWLIGVATGLAGGLAQAQAPGPESFAVPPKTPLEYWGAVDYLVRTGQAKLAVPYLDAFLKGRPDDNTLLEIQDRFGIGSILRLQDFPETAAQAAPLVEMIAAARRRHALDPARLQRFIAALSKSPAEQEYAVERLREAGPYAVPAIIARLESGLDPETRALIVANLGKLGRSAVPPLIAVLDSPDQVLAADAASALGGIGDPRAVANLTYPAAQTFTATPLRDAARRAIARLTGRPFESQPKSPLRTLADEAWRYERHQIAFPGESVEMWFWQGDNIAPQVVARTVAESILGSRFAREALALDPADRPAQSALVSLALEKSAERDGITAVAFNDPTGAFAAALAAGPIVLGQVARTAMADRHPELAAVSLLALGRVTDRDGLAVRGRRSPLVDALTDPDRRVQFAAATALVDLGPGKPFPGSSRVVPVLARFVANQSAPRAVIIDGNLARAGNVAGALRGLGYDAHVAVSGGHGFELATGAADVEVIFLEPTTLQGSWDGNDTLANLRADARTAEIPVILYGALGRSPDRESRTAEMKVRDYRSRLLARYPRTAYLVTPDDPKALVGPLNRELARMGVRFLTPSERENYAQAAATHLARIAAEPGSPFRADLTIAEPALVQAMNHPPVSQNAAAVMGDMPGIDAQRGLADVALDPSRPIEIRLTSAAFLARSLQRFGPLLMDDQERGLVAALAEEADPRLRSALAAAVGALRPRADDVGRRLRAFTPTRPPAPADAEPTAEPAESDSAGPAPPIPPPAGAEPEANP